METRKILIADSKTQRRYEIETAATTLGELQDQMSLQGISFEGMSFTEGLSKTQLLTRDSLLPTNVMYKGQRTNNLVMLLTNTTKNIASGCTGKSRKEAYEIIKELGKTAMEEIKEINGRNYTQVPTDGLWEYIDDNYDLEDVDEDEDFEEEEEEVNTPAPKGPSASHPNTVEWLYDGIKSMVKDNILFLDDLEVLNELTEELLARLKEQNPTITDEDIDAMFASI